MAKARIPRNTPRPQDPPMGNRLLSGMTNKPARGKRAAIAANKKDEDKKQAQRGTPAAETTKMMKGGMTKAAYQAGGKLNMVKGKDGKMVPDYAADGVGKMKKGGDVKKMNMGGMAGMDDAAMMAMKKKRKKPMMPAQQAMSSGSAMPMMKEGGMAKKPKVRGAGIARKGVRAAKMR